MVGLEDVMSFDLLSTENWLSFVPDFTYSELKCIFKIVEETFPNCLTVFSILQSVRRQVCPSSLYSVKEIR